MTADAKPLDPSHVADWVRRAEAMRDRVAAQGRAWPEVAPRDWPNLHEAVLALAAGLEVERARAEEAGRDREETRQVLYATRRELTYAQSERQQALAEVEALRARCERQEALLDHAAGQLELHGLPSQAGPIRRALRGDAIAPALPPDPGVPAGVAEGEMRAAFLCISADVGALEGVPMPDAVAERVENIAAMTRRGLRAGGGEAPEGAEGEDE